jgi:hypothetical protein
MSLGKSLEELRKSSKRSHTVCAYQVMYDNLNPQDKKALDEAWATGMPVSLIVRAIRQEGIKTSADSVRAHQKGICKCPK